MLNDVTALLRYMFIKRICTLINKQPESMNIFPSFF